MSRQYFCKLPRRRQQVQDHARLNGIDYLEVVGDQHRHLALHFLKPVTAGQFGAEHVYVQSNQSRRSIRVLSVSWSTHGQDEAVASNDVLVELERHGDFTTHILSIRQPALEVESQWLDKLLGTIEFSFAAACPGDFDCAPGPALPAAPAAEPDIDYLAKDYASFRQLMLDRISTIMPGWTERNPADLGIAVIETLAYAADQLSYYQDAVATEAYLGTARRRVSVRRHARLLDYRMHDGCSARAWAHIKAVGPEVLLAHTPLLTGTVRPDTLGAVAVDVQVDARDKIIARRVQLTGVPEDRQVFETLHDLTLDPGNNCIELYTWGDEQCCLPRGATGASLHAERRVDGTLLKVALATGDLLLFEEIADADGVAANADASRRHVVRLTAVRSDADTLVEPALQVLNVEWAVEDALPFALCVSSSVARGNIVVAQHGRSIVAEPVALPQAPSTLRQRPSLAHTGISYAVPFDNNAARRQPAATAMLQDPRAALATVSLTRTLSLRSSQAAAGASSAMSDPVPERTRWSVRRDLLRSDRFAEEFVVETESDGRAQLRFGDGVLGRKPAAGTRFLATYRIGNGTSGNIGAGCLGVIASRELDGIGACEVTNPLPGCGGVEPESIEHVRLYAPSAFRKQQRAVVPSDYASLAEQHPQVQKAVATQRWTGSWQTIFLTVDRKHGRAVDEEFEQALRAYLEPYRTMGHDLEIEAPRMVPLDVALEVCVAAGYLRSAVKAALLDAFSNRQRPDGSTGLFHADRLTFGQSVYLSTLIEAAMRVAGVSRVVARRFQRQGEPARGELEAGRIDVGRLEIVRLDNDPNAPANGHLELTMLGGL